jgi:chromatin segregation and condensation protein Rec8/ScpA/Scc1 (kleisin family)
MEGLLTLFVALTAFAVIAQFGVLVAIWYSSKRLGDQFERFMRETREVMVPIKSITENLRVASGNLVEIGMAAREQFRRVEAMVSETGEALHIQVDRLDQTSRDIVNRINETAQVVQDSVVKPFREVSALAKGITRGFEAFLFRRHRSTVDQAHQDEELFI